MQDCMLIIDGGHPEYRWLSNSESAILSIRSWQKESPVDDRVRSNRCRSICSNRKPTMAALYSAFRFRTMTIKRSFYRSGKRYSVHQKSWFVCVHNAFIRSNIAKKAYTLRTDVSINIVEDKATEYGNHRRHFMANPSLDERWWTVIDWPLKVYTQHVWYGVTIRVFVRSSKVNNSECYRLRAQENTWIILFTNHGILYSI